MRCQLLTRGIAAQLLRKVLRLISFVCGALGAGALYLVSPILRIEIQEIGAERIGHLALEPELFLCRRKESPEARRVTLFFFSRAVSNHYLARLWRGKMIVVPRWSVGAIYRFGQAHPRLALRPPEWVRGHIDVSCLDQHPSSLRDEVLSNPQGKALLDQLGLGPDDQIICLAVRDGEYLRNRYPERDWAYHDYRDSTIANYTELAESLADAGFFVLRMGRDVLEPLNGRSPRIIDYASSRFRSDFADLYLFARASLCISTSTGMDSLAMLFRTPLALVNIAGAAGFQVGGPLRLIILKTMVDQVTGTPIGPEDDRFMSSFKIFRTEQFEELGIELRENTGRELRAFGEFAVAAWAAGEWNETLHHTVLTPIEKKVAEVLGQTGLTFRIVELPGSARNENIGVWSQGPKHQDF